jgi:hypothetical protein
MELEKQSELIEQRILEKLGKQKINEEKSGLNEKK